jgi:hypothetical protein
MPRPPPISPFLRAEDLAALADFNFGNANSLSDIDRGLADLATETNFNRGQVDHQAAEAKSSATDNAIARGLFQSSIKDATLYDIEGQRARQQQLYSDRVSNAVMDADRRKRTIQQAQEAMSNRLANQAVQNGRDASAAQQVVVPQPAAAPMTQKLAVSSKPYKEVAHTSEGGVKGKLHIYPDGRKVFVAGV